MYTYIPFFSQLRNAHMSKRKRCRSQTLVRGVYIYIYDLCIYLYI